MRRLTKDRLFSAAAVLTLGLVVGMSTAIFSVANAVWLRPLSMRDAGSLVAIERPYSPNLPLTTWATVPDYMDWRDRARSFEELAMASATATRTVETRTGRTEEQVFFASANLFRVLGVEPLIGRTFRDDDDRGPSASVVLLTEGLWRRAFGGDPSILGKRITLAAWDGAPASYEVIGILPRRFQLEYDLEAWADAALFLPFTDWPTDRNNRMAGGLFNRVYGRLKAGVSAARAQAEMSSLCAALKRAYPKDRRPPAVKVVPLHQELLGSARPIAGMLGLGVAAVLLIGCFNVAALLVARGAAREHEMAIRSSLGSGTYRLIQQELVETLVIAFSGGALGLVIASWATRALLSRVPPTVARVSEVALDGRVLGFVLGVSLVTGLVAGIVPALRAARPRLAEALKRGRLSTGGRRGLRGGYALVAADVGLVLVLLVVSGLMTSSIWQMVTLDLGFDPHDVVLAEISLPKAIWDDGPRWRSVEGQLLDRVRAQHGVASASIIDRYPFPPYPRVLQTVRVAGDREAQALVLAAEGDYAHVMKIPVLRGRFLQSSDVAEGRVAVVNSVFARRFLEDATQPQRLQIGNDWMNVVGVVGDVIEMGSSADASGRGDIYLFGQSWKGLERTAVPTVYVPRLAKVSTALVIKTSADVAPIIAALPSVLRAVDMATSVKRITTMEERVGRTTANNRFYAVVFSTFSVVALLLAAVGVHGVVAQGTRRRFGEIAIRTALGARPESVVLLLMRQSLAAVLVGIAAGIVTALEVTRGLGPFLFGVAPQDPRILSAAVGLLVAVATLAVFLPARRAVRTDPLRILRME